MAAALAVEMIDYGVPGHGTTVEALAGDSFPVMAEEKADEVGEMEFHFGFTGCGNWRYS